MLCVGGVLLLLWMTRQPSYPDLAGNFYAFTADWCLHCKKLLPEWQRFLQMMPRDLGVTPVQVTEGSRPDLARRLGVRGFPTLFLIDSLGTRRDFQGPRTAEGLLAFVKANRG